MRTMASHEERMSKREMRILEEKCKVYPGLYCKLVLDGRSFSGGRIFAFDDYLYLMEEGGAIVLRARWPLSFMARISIFVLAWLSVTFLALLFCDFSATQAFLSVTFLALIMGVAYGRRTVRFDNNSCLLLNNWKRGRGAVQTKLDQMNFEEDQATKWKKKVEEMMRMEAADKLRRQKAKKVEEELEDPVRMCLEGNAAFKAGNWRRQDYFPTRLPPIISFIISRATSMYESAIEMSAKMDSSMDQLSLFYLISRSAPLSTMFGNHI